MNWRILIETELTGFLISRNEAMMPSFSRTAPYSNGPRIHPQLLIDEW